MREWTTAHPKVDPETKEMLLFHSTFLPPYVQYSVIPESESTLQNTEKSARPLKKYVNLPLPGVSSAKMMHDFGVSSTHTVIMDLPVSLDPLNLVKNRPVVEYDPTKPSRFGVFPRHMPELVKWFETKACCIFHTANTWDSKDHKGNVQAVNMIACRLTSASAIFSAGNIAAPQSTEHTEKKAMSFFAKYDADICREAKAETPGLDLPGAYLNDIAYSDDVESTPLVRRPVARDSFSSEHAFELPEEIWEEWTDSQEDQCRLFYYKFDLTTGKIASQYALSRVPLEFPSVRSDMQMKEARYIYGCSTSCASFGAALGKSAKIDVLVKVDAHRLVADGEKQMAAGTLDDCVDRRSISQVLESKDANDAIQAFQMPFGWFAQEPRFVARAGSQSEDDGYLLTYAFNESQLDIEGEVPSDEDESRRARSELWIIDARDMRTVVCRVLLPQRVPYGLHGAWFSEEEIKSQRAVSAVRCASVPQSKSRNNGWMSVRRAIEKMLA